MSLENLENKRKLAVKSNIGFRSFYVFLAIVLIFQTPSNVVAEDEDAAAHRTATAIRIIGAAPPQLDGVLDDEIWKNAPLHEGFRQREPDEAKPATERITFQIAYDDEALYFAVMCYDSEPDKIVSRLVRRDTDIESDRVTISLAPHQNRVRGFWFTVYSSGSVTDGTVTDEYNPPFDDTWDGVWDVKPQIHDNGWAAEFKIPFYILRFSPKDEYTWGLQVERYISRKKEMAHWRLVKLDAPSWVSRFGDLTGIKNINPPRHLEIVPYVMGRTRFDDDADLWGNIGTDVRFGITSGITLDATVNPDFGQVEADPATLNLSAYEEYFSERRPFFVKDSTAFVHSDYSFFYSRRIGRRPRHFGLPPDAIELSRPEATTILGAAKIVGRTEGGTSFGIMEAVTAPEYARIEQTVNGKKVQSDHLVEPLTNYFVGRFKQSILKGNSTLGIITTAVNRWDSNTAYVGGIDWDLRFADDMYQITGTLAGSQAGESDARKSGYIALLEFDKRGGWLRGETNVEAISPDFEMNDLGFRWRTDTLDWAYYISANKEKPFSIFRRVSLYSFGDRIWTYEGANISTYHYIAAEAQFKNYWEYTLGIGRNFESFSERDIRRGGTLIKKPAIWWIFTSISTDSRRRIQLQLNPRWWRTPIYHWDDEQSYGSNVDLNIRIRLAPNIEFTIGPRYNYEVRDAQWVDLVEENINGQVKKHYVYGELESQTLDFTTRADISFTPTLSLQLFLQPFLTVGEYTNFKELVAPKTYQFKPYPLKGNRDFHWRSLRGNTVLRWEFRPGSTLFLVWTQSREADLASVGEADFEFRPLQSLGSSFADEGENIFLVKCRYWFGF